MAVSNGCQVDSWDEAVTEKYIKCLGDLLQIVYREIRDNIQVVSNSQILLARDQP